MSEAENRRSTDALMPEFLQELGAMRITLRDLGETLHETRRAVKEVGDLAVRTDREFKSYRSSIKSTLATAAFFLTLIFSGISYYVLTNDARIESINKRTEKLTEEVSKLAHLAVSNQEENRRQSAVDKQLSETLIEALKAIRKNQER